MNRNRPYDFIKHKLEHSAEADIDALWNDMNKVLDNKMPQQEEKERRVLAWVFRAYLSIIFISIGALSVTVYIKYKESKTSTNTVAIAHASSNSNTVTNKETVPAFHNSHFGTEKIVTSNKVNKSNRVKHQNKIVDQTQLINVSNSTTKSNPDKIQGSQKDRIINSVIHSNPKQASNKSNVYRAPKQNEKLITNNGLTYTSKNEKQNANDLAFIGADKNANDLNIVSVETRKSDPLNITGWEGVNMDKLSPSEKTIVASQPLQKFVNKQKRGWVFGAAVSYNVPVSKQEMTTIDINGKKNVLIDYLPSVSAQYHINNHLYLQTQFQFISPQYTPNVQLASKSTQQSWSKKSESFVTLNKLYYLNLPVSVHYSPKDHFYVGLGIQYSYLKRSILTNENCTWDWAPNGWVMTSDTKTVYVKSNPHKEISKANASGNGNGNGGGNGGNPNNQPPILTEVDTVARSFRSSDWRVLADVNYQYHRFNLGLSFNIGIDKYVSQSVGTTNQKIADRNESIFIYLKYNFMDLRRRK